ncbi:hypothetical protein FOL47_007767, partial [Perkinsus chesapeaki]
MSDDLIIVHDTACLESAFTVKTIHKSMLSILGFTVQEPKTDKENYVVKSQNIGFLICGAETFKNEVVVDALKQAIEGKKNIVLLHWISSCPNIEEAIQVAPEAYKEVLGGKKQIIYVEDLINECNDSLLNVLKLGDQERVEHVREVRSRQAMDDILRFGAKVVSKARMRSSVRKRYDFCITCAKHIISEKAPSMAEHLHKQFNSLAPALSVALNNGVSSGYNSVSETARVSNVRESFNLVILVTANCFTDEQLCEEVRVALEQEVHITLLHVITDATGGVEEELLRCEDLVHRDCLRRSPTYSYLQEHASAAVRKLLLPGLVKMEENKSPRSRAAGVPSFRLEYKNSKAMELPGDGRMAIYKLAKEDSKKNIRVPSDIDTNIKSLFELYDTESKGVVDWNQFVKIDRVITETLGGQYSEMISRRIYSLMLYPGLPLDSEISYTTFYNYHAYVSKKMGVLEGDRDVAIHYKYLVDKAKHMRKGKRFQKTYDLFICHDRSKEGTSMALDLLKSIRDHTPNVRTMLCIDAVAEKEKEKDAKKKDNKKDGGGGGPHKGDPMTAPSKSAESLNVVVILTPNVFENPQVQKDLLEATEAGSSIVLLSDVTTTAEMLSEIKKAPENIKPALSRPNCVAYWKHCDAACSVDLLSLLTFPDWRPQAARSTILAVQGFSPLVRYLFQNCDEDEETAIAFRCLANCTSPSTLNGARVRKSFAREGGIDILAEKFQQFMSVPAVAENACRAVANLAQDVEICRKLAEARVVNMVVECMSSHTDAALLQGEASRALNNLGQEEVAKLRITELSGFQAVLQSQKKFEYEPEFWDGRFAMKRLKVDDVVMVNYRGKGRWCSGKVQESYANGTYDITYAHGGMDKKVPAHWVRPKDESDAVMELCGVWEWKPTGKVTEDELILKADGMCSLRSGAVGTWNLAQPKEGRTRTAIKLNIGKSMIEMERISLTTLRSTTTSERALLKNEFPECVYTEYFGFGDVSVGERMPSLTALRPDHVCVEQEICKSVDGWAHLPEKLRQNVAVRWSGFLVVGKMGKYTFTLDSGGPSLVFVNDKLVVENTEENSSGAMQLMPGNHRIDAQFFSASEGPQSYLNLLYSGPDTGDEQMKVPAAVLQHSVEQSEVVKKPGFLGEYFSEDLGGRIPEGKYPDVVRVEKQLDFEATSEAWENLPARFSKSFAARFTTYLSLKCGGRKKAKYSFAVDSNKCAKVYLDGKLVIEEDASFEVELSSGPHKMQVEYFCGASEAAHALTLKFSGPETIPPGTEDDSETAKNPPMVSLPAEICSYYLRPTVALPRGDPLEAHEKSVPFVGCSDEVTMVSAGADGKICVWDLPTSAVKSTIDVGQPITCGRLSASGRFLAVGLEDGSISQWEVASARQHGSPMFGHSGEVNSVTYCAEDKKILSVGHDLSVRIWEAESCEELANLAANPHNRIGDAIEQSWADCSAAYDDKMVVTGGKDGCIRFWDTEKLDTLRGPEKVMPLPEEPEDGWGEEGPPEPERIPGEPILIEGHPHKRVTCVALCPVKGSNLLATASSDATIKIWDLKDHSLHIKPIQCLSNVVSWSPNGATLVSANEDVLVQLFSAVSGKPRSEPMPGHIASMRMAAWTPQGQCLATCSDDGTIRLWHFTVNRNIAEIAVLEGEEGVFQEDMKKWQKILDHIRHECHDYSKGASEYEKNVEYLRASLDKGVDLVKSYRARASLLGLTPTDYWDLDGMIDDYASYYKLWNTVISFQKSQIKWQQDPMKSINAEQVEQLLDSWFKECYKMIKGFDNNNTRMAQKVAKDLKSGIDEFRVKFPFLRAFCVEAILPRHWDELFAKMKIQPFADYNDIRMQQMLDKGVLNFAESFEEISAAAQKEHSLKKAMAGMKRDWEPLEFTTTLYKETGCPILKGIDEIQAVLDDHIVKTQAIRSSPFCKPFEQEVLEWEATLLYLQDFVDECLAVQRTWMQLEPIFLSDDIKRQLPDESSGFATIDVTFRSRMKQVEGSPGCLGVAAAGGIVEDFKDANEKLEKIQKGLKDYLETKRLYFPRFFFLNDADLLSILAETKDPTLVQPHMGKAFEGIASVRFNETATIINAMISAEGESVDFVNNVDVDCPENKGNVEKWLVEVEKAMIDSLTNVISRSNKDYACKPRTAWCIDYPGQVVLATDCIYWTKEVTEALNGKRVADYEKKLNQQLLDIVQLVRGDLSKLARVTLGAMVTIDVHARDVVSDLVKNNVESADEFDWLSQLRYYWKEPNSFKRLDTGEMNGKEECQVSIVNSTLLYGFEYLGNTPRLVITPLTDRCYRTLMGAFALYYGGAPEGPAGTGKTESTKDLAKALAIQCVVFNCSDGMDYMQMAKFFKGLASSGAWCCFDEFNRINLEVLSVIAQQIQCISLAIKQKAKTFIFEGTEIRLIPSCAVNITMNPGYAGRSELPDNLKALFRPCAMMVPNYALIAEITLYSFGYEDARRIGVKATQALKLSSEQLSAQDHYDFGMRGLKSLLVAAGALKMKYGDQYPEDVISLRAFTDVNLPKFTSADIPLFKGIIGDLFPGVHLPPSDYGPLIAQARFGDKVEACAVAKKLQPTNEFTNKVIQLWETVMVRHGLMTVGLPPCGKTMVKDVLADTLAAVADGGDMFMPVTQHIMNPKSITQGQLYGEADLNTQEWTDGVLAIAVRAASKGPPDTPTTTMIFEVRDLAVASPATVSRCGMVFMEPDSDLGWKPIVLSWLDYQIPDYIRKEHRDLLWKLFENNFEICLECTHRVRTPVAVIDNWLADSACRLMECLFEDSEERYCRPTTSDDDEHSQSAADREQLIYAVFFFAMLWTCGACTDQEGRAFVESVIRAMFENKKEFIKKQDFVTQWEMTELVSGLSPAPLPSKGLLHDYFIDSADGGKWKPWTEKIGNFDVPKDAQFHTIIVPTSDTVRNQFLIRTLIEKGKHVLMSGVTGTGKTVSIAGMLLNGFDKEKYSTISFAFSAQTTANQTQDIIDGKLDKRRKGVFGPPINKKMLVFVDDVNMPAKETYGAQPPIEILRQGLTMSGWYDRKTWEFRQFVDMQYLAAMGPPGGGKNDITDRYSRQFNLIFVTPFDDESLARIFTTMVQKFLGVMPREVAANAPTVVAATIEVYNTMSAEMLPTPAKSHYTFNLRDLSKVFQGICQCTRESLPKVDDLAKCWMHECQRVFEDRLVNKPDHNWFFFLIKRLLDRHFKKQYDQVVKQEPIVFASFVDPKSTSYMEVQDHQKLQEKMTTCLEDFNAVSKIRMDLVLFTAFIQHICRVVRVLKLPLGNALCVGVGGSGRKSTATLAAFVADFNLFQVQISKSYGMTEWRDDMRKLLMSAGMEILEKCSKMASADGKTGPNEVFAWYVENCRKNLHIVLAMSPIGDKFRKRLRMFPSLVNCCTIDWFMEWPPDALTAVAMQFLKTQEMPENVLNGVVKIMVDMQTSVSTLTERFLSELRRHYYVTPTSYLELINSFIQMLKQQRHVVSQAKWRYDVGLEKLADTASQVATMQKELEDLQPNLEKAAKETSEMMILVEKQQGEAAEKQKLVDAEAAAANEQARAAEEIAADCQKDLAAAMPALEAAVDALSKLSKGDITEVKAMKTPPGGVVLVAQALCYFFGVKPNKVPAPDGKGKVDDFWEPAKKELLGDPRLLDRLINFDKDNISEEAMKKVKPLYDDPNFEPEVIKKASIAAMGICKWARAMVVYDKVAKEVGPKRAALAQAEGKAAAAKAKLAEKEAELAEVIALVDKLVSDLNNAKEYMEELQKQRDDCAAKLIRAEKLITGLGGEKSRWTAASNRLGTDYNNLSGDILIASGIIAYLGVFTASYRSDVMEKWLGRLQDLKIPASPQFSLQACIGDAVKIRQWVIDKLPNDSLSIDNAIILSNSRRWPLMIDPQQQANKWIKNMEKNLQVLRLSKNYARELENAIQFGNPVLIENIAETLDPMLDPLLQKATFKQGNLEMIRLGDSTIEWSKDFRLYFTTKLPNPHYAPEICVSVTILNFMATVDGLQDQMLGIVVAKEEPEIEAKRVSLVVESAQSKAQLKEIEDRILALLSSATGNILDDEELIETLSNSKIASQKIEEQVQQQERTAAQIQETRQSYRPLALRSASLFFVVSDLCIVDPMYQYSLDWFIMIFIMSIDQAEKAPSPADRMANLSNSTIRLLYVMVCRSLFEAHRLLFSMQLAFKMQEVDKELNFKQMRLFLTGGGGGGAPSEEKPPDTAWLTDISWGRVLELAKLGETFDGFQELFKSQLEGWKAVFDSDNPRDLEWPMSFEKKCSPLEKALVLLAVRADALVPAIQEIVDKKLGSFFLEPPPFDLEACYNDSKSCIPLVFVLSSGSDPMADIIKLAEGKGMLANISAISLGQGQGPKAMAALEEGTKHGKWVLLQNCHLAVSWMPVLEKVVEDFREEDINPAFRLWLTAMPSPAFPISVLQNGIKMTLEPPKGLKNSLVRAYMGMDDEWFESCSKPQAFKKLLFGLCFFHAVILERRQFGPLGWNIPYQFSEPDRDISRQQLKNFLDDFEGIPWKALSYMVAEANYGGRVTDAQDRRAIVHILTDYYTERILKEEYKFSISGIYFAPKEGTLSSYMEYIRELPINQTPEVFWLHNNANLTAAINEGMEILRTAVMLMPKTGGGDAEEGEKEQSPEEIYGERAAEIVASLPPNFDVEAVQRVYPVRYDQCLNTVLVQELLKCNKLLNKLRDTLVNLQKAVKGLVVFSPDLEEVAEGLLSNKVPSVWAKVSYPSLKPLGSYVADFLQRLKFFDNWIKMDAPTVFWFSGFFFQQAFLTGVLQNFARKDKIAIDRCIWNMEVLKADNTRPDEPEKGCIIRGLFMDGARWDDDKMVIADSFPKVLFSEVPCIWLKP